MFLLWYLKKRNHPPEALRVSSFGKQNSEYLNLKFYFVLAIRTARNLKTLDEKTKGNFMIFGMNPVKGLTVLVRL